MDLTAGIDFAQNWIDLSYELQLQGDAHPRGHAPHPGFVDSSGKSHVQHLVA